MKRLTALLSALLLAAALTACGSKSEEPPKIAQCIAIANTANSRELNLTHSLIQERVQDVFRGYGYLSLVRIDGSPALLAGESCDIPQQHKKAAASKLEADAKNNTAALLNRLGEIRAEAPEADYLEGLRLAARSLAGLTGYDKKEILMAGTGLSTAGTLDFRNNLLSAQPEALADLLEQRQELPDLSGITVTWIHLGETASPQPDLSQAQKAKLRQIWQTIVERSGGSFVCMDVLSGAGKADASLPVSVVELAPQEPIVFAPEEPAMLESPLVLTEEQVCFVGDQATYLHPEEAAEVLAPIADYLRRNESLRVVLAGTTAGDSTGDYCDRLSLDRANTVRNTLIGMGISEGRITTLGLGSHDPWHIYGAGTDGPLAAANRKVVILDAASPTAQELLAS